MTILLNDQFLSRDDVHIDLEDGGYQFDIFAFKPPDIKALNDVKFKKRVKERMKNVYQ